MARILVTHSKSHPVNINTVNEELIDHTVTDVEIPAGGMTVNAEEKMLDAISGQDGLLLRPGNITRNIIGNAPDLKIIAVHGSGYDHVDVESATRNGIVVTHSPEAPAPAVVEHTFGAMFSLLRDFHTTFQQTSLGKWNEAKHTLTELSECTIGVIGLGTIGFDVARHASQVFNADVIGYDPYMTGELNSLVFPRHDYDTVKKYGIELTDKNELFRASDIVSVHAPFTKETDGMIGKHQLSLLQNGYLINLSRGGIVDEAALLSVIEEDSLKGVFLDVLENEPPSIDNPLLNHSNVLITPHVGGVTNSYFERAAVIGARKIRTVLNGEQPPMVVNPQLFNEKIS